MISTRLITLTLFVALVSCIYILSLSPRLLQNLFLKVQQTDFDSADIALEGITGKGSFIGDSQPNSKDSNLLSDESTLSEMGARTQKTAAGAGKRLEIFGHAMDENHQPIDNVLVAGKQYLFKTRTDSQGNFKIFLDLSGNQLPELHFMRSGFQEKNIEIDAKLLEGKSVLELNVVLIDDADFIPLAGWIGNDIGVGLGGIKIQLTSNDKGLDKNYRVAFSDVGGHFSFEGVKGSGIYRLTVFSPAGYLPYVDEKFTVTPNSAQLNIVLESIEFVNIDGMIVNTKSVPVPDFEMYIRNISTGMHVEKLVSDSSGFFSLQKFPAGEMSLTTQGPDYFRISGLTLEPNEYRNLNLIVDKGDHYLSGWVSDENAIPVEGASVSLEAKGRVDLVEYSSHRVKKTDSAGIFYFDDLGSNEYLIKINAFGFHKYKIMHRIESQTDELHATLTRR